MKIDPNKHKYAIFCDSEYGPTFGYDIFIANNANTTMDSYSNFGDYFKHPQYALGTNEAKAFLAEKGFDPDMGARPLARTIQRFVEDPIAEELLKGEAGDGATIEVDYEKDAVELKISMVKKKEPKKKKDAPPVSPTDN